MRVKQVLAHLEEGWADLLSGAVVGSLLMQKKKSAGVAALAITAATYANLVKLAPAHRKNVVVTAKTQAEALANQRIVQQMLDKMSYKLDSVEHIGTHGRKWSLSAK